MSFSYVIYLIELFLIAQGVYMDITDLIFKHIPTIVNIIVALTTLYMAYAMKSMARVTQKTLDEQSKPYVIVYAQQRRDAPSLLQVVIENIGSSTAYDIEFSIKGNFSIGIFNLQTYDENKKYIPSAFMNGIKQIVPNQKIIFNWGRFNCLTTILGEEQIKITTSFKNILKIQEPDTIADLDVKSFAAACAHAPTDVEQLEEIKKIPVNISNLTKLLDKKLHPQSPEATYMWAYVAWKLLEGKYPREYIVQYGSGAGLTEEQLASAQEAALCLLREYRPELVRDEDLDSNY